MIRAVSRILLASASPYAYLLPKRTCQSIALGLKHANYQLEYLRTETINQVPDWAKLKDKILTIPGSFTQKNIDGVLLKILVTEKKFDLAQSLADYLLSSGNELNLGATNGILLLYTELSKTNKLSDAKQKFILETYTKLYSKYKVPDYLTCERLLHALCAIDDWKKAMKVFDDIQFSCNPSHSACSTLIATLFRVNKKTEALKFVEKSILSQRPLLDIAYEEWIKYIFRKYKLKKTIENHLDELCSHLSRNFVVMPELAAEKLREAYESIGWNAKITKIRRNNGQCLYCKGSLECLKLSEDEFQLMQSNVKDKLIVGSDLFLKTSPEELKRFLQFVEETAPYDIVLDALNISYAIARHSQDKIGILSYVVDYFRKENKKILLLGRKHMLNWPRIPRLLSKTCSFFTDDLSQDDPYFITAAILSGSHTDFVSRDLLRGHRFRLQSEQLSHLFQRWQWQHQWKVYNNISGRPNLQPPLPITPCAQNKNSNWHLPFERADASASMGAIKDGTPDWSSWLCLQTPRGR